MLREARIPTVEIWDVSPHPIDMVIGFDHAQVGAEVAAMLLAKGHRRFATLGADDDRAVSRSSGFRQAVMEQGGELVAEESAPAPSTVAAGREGLKRLLPVLTERCALLCSSDLLAVGVLTEARMQGVAVPERLAVCGFGNLELAAMNEPALTTVNLEGPATGRSAAAFLLRRLAGETPRDADRVQVPFQIVERATT
jgi:LacI family gluconate utilization system Gnt-I transcriptional repressor